MSSSTPSTPRAQPTDWSRRLVLQVAPYAALALLLALATTPLVSLVACGSALLMLVHGRREALHSPPRLRAFVALALGVAFYAWLVTRGTFAWEGREAIGSAYDSLARSLRQGSAEVRPEDIQIEAWRVGGRTFMYFGPLPALLRVLPDLLAPSLHGRWSRASVLLATLLCLWAVVSIARRQLAANARLDAGRRDILFFATLAAVGLGSPLVLLGSLASLYHEAILWGLCSALWGVYFTLGVLRDDDPHPSPLPEGEGTSTGSTQARHALRNLALLSGAAGGALLSRISFGLPLYALVVLLALRHLVLRVRRERRPVFPVAAQLALALLPAFAAGLFQLWYNHARFGSPFEAAPFSAYGGPQPSGIASPFHWSRIPSGLWAYLRISADNFRPHAPFLTFAHPVVPRPELYTDLTTLLLSPLLTSPWCVLALVGGLALPGGPGERRRLLLCALPFAGQCVLIFSYYWLGQRFTAEFLPLLVLLLAAYLRGAGAEHPVARLVPPRAFALAAAVSVVATVASTFHFQSRWWAYPPEYRQAVTRTFEAIDAKLGLRATSGK
jgi:hypothetical protein